MSNENEEIKSEMDNVINELESLGLKYDEHNTENTEFGLGDAVEAVLTKAGITEERFKRWFNLKECNCSKRKKWLNNLFTWKRDK
mgnify:CR=1 FL=1